MKRSAIVLSVWIAALCTPTTQAADDVKITRASLLTQPCFSCHGTNGNSVGAPLPSLAGQTEETLRTSLLAFKKGERPATLMTRIAKGYSDEDLQLIANYLATEAKPTH